jgi:chemotaxis signal transduction protein
MSNAIADSGLDKSVHNQTLIKLLVFEIGKLTLAVPILQVQKIVKQNEVYGSGLSHVNLTHLPEQEIAIVDLHQKLFGTCLSTTKSSECTGYFIIIRNPTGEPVGIAVSQAPTLMDVSLEQIRQLPEAYRRADTLEIASHVLVIPQSNTPRLIFLLDLTRLV